MIFFKMTHHPLRQNATYPVVRVTDSHALREDVYEKLTPEQPWKVNGTHFALGSRRTLLDRFRALYEARAEPDWEWSLPDSPSPEEETPMEKPRPTVQILTPDLQYDGLGRLKVETPLERYAEVKTVGEDDLPNVTREGWRLVAIVQEQTYVTAQETQPVGGGQFGTVMASRAMPSITNRYLVGRDETSALAESHRLRMEAEEKRGAAVMELKRHAEAAQAADKLAAQVTDLQDTLQRAEDRETHAARSYQERIRKYEIDIGKLRAALGDLRMTEILGPKDAKK
jgi:hypothetical protein